MKQIISLLKDLAENGGKSFSSRLSSAQHMQA